MIRMKDINYNELIKNIATTLKDSFKSMIERANFDRTFKAKIIGKTNDGRYQILYRGNKYTVTSETNLYVDQIVNVCAPQNNWSELFVVSSKISSGNKNRDINDSLYNGNYRLTIRNDGNLVIYRLSDNHIVWTASGLKYDP